MRWPLASRVESLPRVALLGLGKTEKGVEIRCRHNSDFFRGKISQYPNLRRNFADEGRFVALAAMRNGRKIRTIGLDKHATQRNHAGRVANILRLGVRDIACERNNEAQIERSARMIDGAGETMHHAAQSSRAPMFARHLQQVVPCVFTIVGWPAVN